MDFASISRRILEHYLVHRRDLPWRRSRDPYAVWISEIMLQQTRVTAVIPYYERWLERFPSVADLAAAPLDDVLSLWSGLGYYSRARNLHRCAQAVVEQHQGALPQTAKELRALPGIGRYTAGAIASIAYGKPEALVDGNVARVLSRIFAVEGDVRAPQQTQKLWDLAEKLVPAHAPGDFNQGLMELGAVLCTPRSPRCGDCPVRAQCQAQAQGRQHELPSPRKRVADGDKPHIELQALWILRRNKLLLARRRPRGLYGGLWELPSSGDRDELECLTGLHLNFDDGAIQRHMQILSHRRLELVVWKAQAQGRLCKRPAAPYDRLAWFSLDEAHALGLSSATRNIVQRQLEPAHQEPT